MGDEDRWHDRYIMANALLWWSLPVAFVSMIVLLFATESYWSLVVAIAIIMTAFFWMGITGWLAVREDETRQALADRAGE